MRHRPFDFQPAADDERRAQISGCLALESSYLFAQNELLRVGDAFESFLDLTTNLGVLPREVEQRPGTI